MTLRSDREIFAKLLIIQKFSNVDLEEFLEHELSLIPLSLGNPDGLLAKPIKMNLFIVISNEIQQITIVDQHVLCIDDGMVLLQKLSTELLTFRQICHYIIGKLIKGKSRVTFFLKIIIGKIL